MGKIKRPPGGRPKARENFPPSLARIMIRQHQYLQPFAMTLFGPYRCAEEAIRRYKEACEQPGRKKFDRAYAIREAAKLVGLPERKLRNWLLRSKRIRDRDA
jgi:hypothetical protein